MNTPNVKIYIAISGILIILFLVVTFFPFGKKTEDNNQLNFPTPTSVDTYNPSNNIVPTTEAAKFTGAEEKEIPQEIIDIATQKQNLQSLLPLELSTFIINFDYSEDKFIVTLNEPKDQARSEFENWRNTNYTLLKNDQFNFR